MRFRFYHEIFETEFIVDENTLPDWINHKQYNWFKTLIINLQINEYIQSDFHKITRIE